MDKSDPDHPLPTENSSPEVQGEQFINLEAKSRYKTTVTISLEAGASLDLIVSQVDADGKPVSLQRKSFTNALEPHAVLEPEPPIQAERTPKNSIEKQAPARKLTWQVWLIGLALLVYLVTRFIGLDAYPIYFFTDEAVQTVLAADMVRDGFRNYQGELLPTYLVNGGQYNLSTSVYAQVLPWLLFGKSIWVTRGTSVLISLLAALAIGLLLKNNLKSKYAFAGILILCITPAWFLHSRTAFEVVMAVSFYAAFLYCYLQYRQGNPKYLYVAVVFGALSFYSYSPAQLVMAVTALALLLTDSRCHIKNWKTVLISLGIAALLAVPYVRFIILHPEENLRHLQILDSYWIQTIPLSEKLGIYFMEYLKMLNPLYWFMPNQVDLERHIMKDYGHLLLWTLPFYVLGFGVMLRKIAKPEYRLFLIATLAAPAGAAMAGIAVTRSLFMVIPAVLLTAIGLDQLMQWIEKVKVPRKVLIGIIFVGLSVYSGFILRDALVNGPLWYDNYGLGGQQYGAKQVFGQIKTMLEENPKQEIFISPSWANGTDVTARFFFDGPLPFEMGSIDAYLFEMKEINQDKIFILIPEELAKAQASNKFKPIEPFKTLDYPNGEPGFYFAHLQYVDHIIDIFAEEQKVRLTLTEADVVDPQGRALKVSTPNLDMGEAKNVFDGDGDSLIRTLDTNPMRLEIRPDEALALNQVSIRIGGTASTVTIRLIPADGSAEQVLVKQAPESNDLRDIVFTLDQSVVVEQINIEILNLHDGERAHVHLWEVSLN
jgi:4-amino-4-deoxy-L-arabinose transferase-like glycosyltransferase